MLAAYICIRETNGPHDLSTVMASSLLPAARTNMMGQLNAACGTLVEQSLDMERKKQQRRDGIHDWFPCKRCQFRCLGIRFMNNAMPSTKMEVCLKNQWLDPRWLEEAHRHGSMSQIEMGAIQDWGTTTSTKKNNFSVH